MVLHDDRTGRGYPLPHPDNLLEDDVQRLRDAIDGLDWDVTALEERADVADAALAGLEAGKADTGLTNVPAAAFQAKAAAAGLALPTVTAGDAGKSLVVNPEGTGYAVGAPASTIQQTGPLYAPGGAGFNLMGKSVLAAYEQVAGQTFGLDYNTRASYAEQDGVNGTDAVGGAFALHNTAGAVIDANTKLLIHADGVNGSTEIIDERGITPFGTHCAYIPKDAQFLVPKSYKLCFGASQNFTMEAWVRLSTQASGVGDCHIFDCSDNTADNEPRLRMGYIVAQNKFYFTANGNSVAANITSAYDTWHHVAFVRYNGVMTLYVNGVAVGSSNAAVTFETARMLIGQKSTSSAHGLDGWMDQFRVSKSARYAGNFTPSTVEFVTDLDTIYLFQFNDGHGSQFIRDSAKSGHPVFLGNNSSVSNTRAKFGSTSLVGNAQIGNLKTHADFAMGLDDFQLDFWAYPTAFGSGKFFSFEGTGYDPRVSMDGSGLLKIALSNNNSSYNIAADASTGLSLTLNTWNHVALFRSGTNVYVAVNGNVYATAVGTAVIGFSGARINLNRHDVTDNITMSGNIDAVRVLRGKSLWSGSFTPPTTAPVVDDNTILLLDFEGSNGDKVTLDRSESSYGASGFSGSSIAAYYLTMTGTIALDTTYTRGGHGTSLRHSGASSQWSTWTSEGAMGAGHALYFSSSEKLCFEGWFYFSSYTASPVLFGISDGTSAGEWWMDVSSSGVPRVSISNSTVASGPVLSGTGWHHIAYVREGRGWVIYSDGIGSTPASPQTNPGNPTGTQTTLSIGSYRGGSANLLTGAIDSVRITHGKPRYTANFTPGNLTQDEETALLWVFDGAVGQKWVKELSKNIAMIQSTNARTVKDGLYLLPSRVINTPDFVKLGAGSLYFDGVNTTGGGTDAGSAWNSIADFTVDAWIKRDTSSATNRTIVSKYTSGSNVFIFRSNASLKLELSIWVGSTIYTVTSLTTLARNIVYHVAGVRSGNSIMVFINGVLEATTTTSGTMNANTTPVRVGSWHDGTNEAEVFSGYMDEIRISNVARWTSNFTPPTIPYGQQYVTGPFWVATKPGTSALDLTAFSSIAGVAFTGATPPGTSITYLLSTDGYATPLRRWTGSAWAATAHSMSWNATTKALATSATAAQLNAAGNSFAELQAGLRALDASAVASLNVVAVLASNNPQFSPSLDAITLNMDEYQIMQPGADYTVRRKKANGVQTLEFKRLKPGNANHVVDYVG